MRTTTKNTFTDDQIKKLVIKHFPDTEITSIKPISGGSFNTLYLIEGSGELREGVILKTGPAKNVAVPKHEKNILQTEVYAYEMLKDKKIPVPQIFAYDFSKAQVPCDYFIMERIHGSTWYEHWPIKDANLMRELGKYTARIHGVEVGWFGYINGDTTGRFDTWGEAFLFMIDEALEDIKEQGLKLPFDKIRNAILSRRELLNTIKRPALINFDMWAGNIFIKKKEKYGISGIIDFERSFLGDPLASFVSAFLLYEDVEKEKDFLEGYNGVSKEALIITEEDREKMVLYQILMYLRGYCETQRYNFFFCFIQRTIIRMYLTYFLRKLNKMSKKRIQVIEYK